MPKIQNSKSPKSDDDSSDNEEENVESPRIKYLTQEYDVKKTNSTNYNDPAMQYYPGWNWKQKRENCTRNYTTQIDRLLLV